MKSSWPQRVVVGVDESREAACALDRALELAERAGSSVVVVHAIGLLEGGSYRPHFELDDFVADARERVGCAVHVPAQTVTEQGPARDTLLRVCARVGGDLVVVGRRGVGLADRPLGSTSEGVLDRAQVPVLVVAH